MIATLGRRLGEAGSTLPEQIEAFRRQARESRAGFGWVMAGDAESGLNLLAAMMGEAGVYPAAIYAFKRTGGLFPTGNMPLTPDELDVWNLALDEYYAKMRSTRKQ
jgi:hypothetical protein